MKNKLTKIYNIFKQIENMKGSTGWDQTDVFYYFYENNQFINCCKLLYGLFCENKNLKPSVFGTTLMELRKYANGFSVIYEFGNSEYPILVATFDRNGKHQISGTVKVEETSISEEKEITFVDGINVDSDNSTLKLEYGKSYIRRDGLITGNLEESYGDDGLMDIYVDSKNQETYNINGKRLNAIGIEIIGINNKDLISENNLDSSKTYKNWISYINSNLQEVNQYNISLNLLMVRNNISFEFIKKYLIEVDNLTLQELMDLSYVEDRIDIHLEQGKIDVSSIFNSETMVTEFIDLTDSEAESRVYEGKDVSYHDDNDELLTINTPEQLEAIIELYGANSNRFFFFPETKEMFRINGEIPESLESLEEVKLFLDYLYDDCNLVGAFHPDDSLDNYTDEHGDDLFNQQQVEKYNKYLDDMFELDADGDSEFVKAGYEDIYDYCMNYRNDNHGINENYPIKLQYGCTYVRRDGIISGQLSQNVNEEGKLTNVFHDSENGLDYQINGKLIGGEYNRKNAEDLIAENFDYTSYLEDGKLSVGISFQAIPTKYPSSLNFVSDGLGGYVSYVTFEIGENSSEELRNFGLNVNWNNSTNSWKITTNNQYEHEVFYIDENSEDCFPITLNNRNLYFKVSPNEDKNNQYYVEFYLTKEGKNIDLIGDCEIYLDELKMVIDSIEWTLPEYEDEIDPNGELYEAEQLMEIVSNEDKIEVPQPIKIKKFEYICNDCGEDFESKYKQTGCASCGSWNIREI